MTPDIMLGDKENGEIVAPIVPYLQIPETKLKYQTKPEAMRTVVMSNSSVDLEENASLRGGSATTTKIARTARTNTTVLPRNAMLVSSPVSVTNSTTPIVFPATLDVIKNKIVMMAQTKKAAIIVHAKKMISSAVTVFACLRKRVAMDTLIVAIKKTKKGAKAHLATFLNSDVPTAKNASPNFRNATIAKNALTDLMRAIAIFLHVIVVSSDVKIIVVFPPVGIAMATKIAQMVPMKTIAPPSLAQKTNSFVLREVPMPHPNA